ncbi:MAG: hypothetical protein ACK5Q5_24320 [Planctomycetaceae bacterium]
MFFSLFPTCFDPRSWASLLSGEASGSGAASNAEPITLLSDERFSSSTLERTGFAAAQLAATDELSVMLRDYVRESSSRTAADTDDVEHFLYWSRRQSVTPGGLEGDEEATTATDSVEYLTLKQRLAATRFAEQRHEAGEPTPTPALLATVSLNPDHVWSWVQPRTGVRPDDQVAAAVFLYAVDREVRAVQLTPDVAALLRRLEQSGPQRFRSIVHSLHGWSRPEVCQLLHDLQRLGIVAIS